MIADCAAIKLLNFTKQQPYDAIHDRGTSERDAGAMLVLVPVRCRAPARGASDMGMHLMHVGTPITQDDNLCDLAKFLEN